MVLAAGDGVDKCGNLHAMRQAQVHNMYNGEPFGGFQDGGVGGGEAEAVPRG